MREVYSNSSISFTQPRKIDLLDLYCSINLALYFMIHFFEFLYIELTLAIAEPSYTVAEDAGVLSVSVTVTGETDIIVTGRYVTFRFLQSGCSCTKKPTIM